MSIVPPYCGHSMIDCSCRRPALTAPVFTTRFPKSPHRCPVCGGNGLVANGFYTQVTGIWSASSTESETCRSCQGSGIVWQPE